ncbi:MAG: hypothetical protein ACOZFS_01350 [Thermodesulfobacteriota bacterium]
MGRQDLNIWNVLLLAGIALMLVWIINIWSNASGPQTQSQSGKQPAVPVAPLLRDQQPLSDFAVVATKNLFSQDRTGPNPAGSGKAQENLEGRQLLGTIIIGDKKAALLSGKAAKPGATEVEVIFPGDQWAGFKVVDISNTGVILQGKDGRRTLAFPE